MYHYDMQVIFSHFNGTINRRNVKESQKNGKEICKESKKDYKENGTKNN